MPGKRIYFKRGYKYQLSQTVLFDGLPSALRLHAFIPDYATLWPTGDLVVYRGYAWDGASGPAWDTTSSMRASLAHDVLYQMLRAGLIPPAVRSTVDDIFHAMLLEDGMPRWRAALWWWAVTRFARRAATEDASRRVEVAP